jgi:PHD/YefM family antitoxin component YafN of YafNO toxin-antitoxin module
MKALPRRAQEENLNLQEDKAEGVQQPSRWPVTITQRNKPRLVLLSIEDYRRLTARADRRRAGRLETMPDNLFEGVKEAVGAYEQEVDET